MKILLNYDLIDKIKVAQTGIKFKEISKSVATNMILYTPLTFLFNQITNTPEDNLPDLLFGIGIYTALNSAKELALFKNNMKEAESDLIRLVSCLDQINVSTTYDQLLESQKYKTEYKLLEKNDEAIRKLQQNKYILIPTKNDEEVSILQEHVIGTKDYSLSIGAPQKVLKLTLANNPA